MERNKITRISHILLIMLLYIIVIVLSGILALFVRFDFSFNAIDVQYLDVWVKMLPIQIVYTLAAFYILRMYHFIWHFVSTADVAKMIVIITATEAVYYIASLIGGFYMPRSVAFMTYIFKLIMFVAIRCSARFLGIIRQKTAKRINQDRIMIVGAGKAADELMREIRSNPENYGVVKCLIDDNPIKKNKKFFGVPIVGGKEAIVESAEKYDISLIIFAIPSAPADVKKEILGICKETGAKVKALPSLGQLYNGEVTVSDIKDVEIEDLLGRDPIKLDNEKVKDFIQGKVVMVTGGGGSIGSEIARQVALNHPKKLILIDSYENNVYSIQQDLRRKYGSNLDLSVIIASVRDKERIYRIFDEYRPEIVFHAAAHKHVPLMEDAPSEAIKNNIFGTYHVVRAAEKFGAKKFVMISTDKAVNPTNVMGATKRFCEMIIQSRGCHVEQSEGSTCEFACVRFGNVLGSNGSVVPLFKKQIAEGGPVTVTDKRITRFFMTIPEAVQLVLEAGSMAKQNQVFVLDMGEPVKIIDLAENLISLSGKKPYKDIDIVEVGLRPGEKLYEELLMKSEHLIETENKKIFVEEQGEINPDEIMANLERLDKAVTTENLKGEELIELMHEIVPTYVRKN